MSLPRRRILALIFGFFALSSVGPALAQMYPTRPITLVVPFARDGAADIVGRMIAGRLSDVLKQPVNVANHPGRGGTVGTQFAAQAAPDGYTLLLATNSTHIMTPITVRQLGYDPLKSFLPVSLLSSMPAVVAVPYGSEVRTLDALFTRAKAAPGKLRFAHGGAGSGGYFNGELVKSFIGLDLRDAAYKGPAASLQALAAGEADMAFESAVVIAQGVRSERLRAIAVMGHSRTGLLPDVPTTAEAGHAGLTAYNWQGLLVPVGTSAETVAVLHRAVQSVLGEIEAQATFARVGLIAEGSSAEEFRRIIESEFVKWSRALPLSTTIN